MEECGIKIHRLVTDNFSTHVKMFARMNGGILHHIVPHPIQDQTTQDVRILRPLFLSFDYCHGIKNVRNQHVDRCFVIEGVEVSSNYLLELQAIQQGKLVRPVINLTRKHTKPNNLERQKVKYAMDIFRSELISTVRLLSTLNRPGFENLEATVTFLETFHKSVAIHDVSSTTEHIFQPLPRKKPFYSAEDERLTWLTTTFIEYVENWRRETMEALNALPFTAKEKRKNIKKQCLTKETLDALLFTSKSTAECIRYLLTEQHFYFVLTRRFNSDPIEQMFGSFRQMMGGNFQGDAMAVSQAFQKSLRTGIVSHIPQ